ncbi:MAG: NfeD family protein [Mycobacteriales bacterium]
MSEWVVWLVVAGALLVAELLTLTLVLGLLSGAAAVTAVVALLGAPLAGQVAAFAVSGAALLLLVRPLARRHRAGPAITTGAAALTGRTALVLVEVTDHTGRVKVGGESWSARPLVPGTTVPVGATVAVATVEGATLVVYPEEI